MTEGESYLEVELSNGKVLKLGKMGGMRWVRLNKSLPVADLTDGKPIPREQELETQIRMITECCVHPLLTIADKSDGREFFDDVVPLEDIGMVAVKLAEFSGISRVKENLDPLPTAGT